jgi:hypothetical protein
MNRDVGVAVKFRSIVGEDSHLCLESAFYQERARFYITNRSTETATITALGPRIGDRWFYVSRELEDSIMSWSGFDHDLYSMLLALGLGVKASFVASVQMT